MFNDLESELYASRYPSAGAAADARGRCPGVLYIPAAALPLVRLDERLAAAPEPVRAGWLNRALTHEAVASQRLNGVYVSVADLTLMLNDTVPRIPDHDLGRAVDTHRLLAALMRRNLRQLSFTPLRLMAQTRLRLPKNHAHRDEALPVWLRAHLGVTSPERIRDVLQEALDPAIIAAFRRLSPLEGAGAFLHHWHATGAADSIGTAVGRALAMAWVRRSGLTSGYCLFPSIGFLGHAAAYRPDLESRWPGAFLGACERAADWGLKLHGRLMAEYTRLHRAARRERATSRMGDLVDVFVAEPAISARTAGQALGITPHAARALIGELREKNLVQQLTDRGSFRLYGLPQ